MIAEILDSDVVSTTEAHSLQDAIEMANELLIYQCNGHGRCTGRVLRS